MKEEGTPILQGSHCWQIYTYEFMCARVCMCVSACAWLCICMCLCICVYTCIYMCTLCEVVPLYQCMHESATVSIAMSVSHFYCREEPDKSHSSINQSLIQSINQSITEGYIPITIILSRSVSGSAWRDWCRKETKDGICYQRGTPYSIEQGWRLTSQIH